MQYASRHRPKVRPGESGFGAATGSDPVSLIKTSFDLFKAVLPGMKHQPSALEREQTRVLNEFNKMVAANPEMVAYGLLGPFSTYEEMNAARDYNNQIVSAYRKMKKAQANATATPQTQATTPSVAKVAVPLTLLALLALV